MIDDVVTGTGIDGGKSRIGVSDFVLLAPINGVMVVDAGGTLEVAGVTGSVDGTAGIWLCGFAGWGTHLRVVEGLFGPEAPFVADQQRLVVGNPRLAVIQRPLLFYVLLRLGLAGV
ncbi:hypothetical protein OUZ56_010614 [Daphnia magna]|uniref:Uncharacterized protein n=1 Tax=Daphnia magna TaxID=35525 RepID=A0ABR0AJ19_9CRUS|nr:hypothetical protein OUZ56_010614 [Daphnia magna]